MLISPYPDLLPDVFCLMVRIFSLMLVFVLYIYIYIYVYRVLQDECTKLRESVPYVKLYRYNPKHLCPKLNGYGDNGQRNVWSSGGSTHCTCNCTSLIEAPSLCMVSNYGNSAHDSPELHMTSLQLDNAVHIAAGL